MPEGGKRTRETVVPLRIFAAPFLKAQLELTRPYFLFVGYSVGYFANAQYDVLRSRGLPRSLRSLAMTRFIPYRHFVPLPPKEEARATLGKVYPEGGSEGECLLFYSIIS